MKIYITILLTLALTQGVLAQTDKKIIKIDSVVQVIKNNKSNYKQEVKKWADSIGLVRMIYWQDKIAKYVTTTYHDNNLDKKAEYYFSNGYIIYGAEIWTDTNSVIVKNERFYLEDGHLIQYIKTDNKKVDKDSKEFKETDKELSDMSKSWRKSTK